MRLGLVFAIGGLTLDMYLPALPQVASQLDAGDAAVQVTLTGVLVGSALGQLVFGPLSDALGRRAPLLSGIGLHVLASLLCALAPDVTALVCFRLLQGLACAAISVCGMALVRDLFAGGPAAALLSRLMLVIGTAPVIAPGLGGLVTEHSSWRGVFLVLAVLAALSWVLVATGIPETLPVAQRRSARPASSLRTYRSLLTDRTYLALVLVAGLTMAAMFGYLAGSPFVLQEAYGLSPRGYGVVVGVNALGLVLCGQLNPRLVARWQPRRVLTGGVLAATLATQAALLSALTGAGGLLGVVVPWTLLMCALGLVLPNTPALALARHGATAGSAAALLGASQFGIAAVAPPVVGAVGAVPVTGVAVVVATASLAASLLVVTVVARDRGLDAVAHAS